MHLILANFDQADFSQGKKRLTAGQQARLATIKSEKAQSQFVWSRVLYNGLMRRITGALPTFELVAGKPHPSFTHEGQTYYTSISHTGSWVAVAFDTAPIAIDIETMKAREWQKLSEFAFPEATTQWIKSTATPLEAFYIVWGQMECDIKMKSYEKTSRLFRATKIKTQPNDLMLTCLCDSESPWQPILLPITLLENF